MLDRGLMSREELEGLIAREEGRAGEERGGTRAQALAGSGGIRTMMAGAPGARKRRLGEILVSERYVSASILDELLAEQRAGPEAAAATVADRRLPAGTVAGRGLLDLVAFVRDRGAHEMVIVPGRPPAVRFASELVPFDSPALALEEVQRLAGEAFTAEELGEVARGAALVKVLVSPVGRFRAILMPSAQGLSLTMRTLDLSAGDGSAGASMPPLPPEVARLADLRRGLVVIAGGHGSGRSRVLAELVALMNERGRRHVVTIESQISYEHPSRRSLVAQREVGYHTRSYDTALRAALREDVDVVVVGELGDPDAIATALLAAETGLLVICSLHAADPVQAVRRLVDVQGAGRRNLIRATLANTLQAIAVIEIVPGRDGKSFLVADLVPGSTVVTRLIPEDRLHQLATAATSAAGVVWRDDAVVKLFQAGRISRTAALEAINDLSRLPDDLPGVD